MTTKTIHPPADARECSPGSSTEPVGRGGSTARCTPWAPTVTITGRQFDDGTVLRGVALDIGGDELLDADEARSVAAVLIVVAGNLEKS